MLIGGPLSFYVLRFLPGVAEAGVFPGIILYLTWWFPERQRARALSLFMTAIAAAYVGGGPLSGGWAARARRTGGPRWLAVALSRGRVAGGRLVS
jgi:MFS family permease